jgi:hypothetical protein
LLILSNIAYFRSKKSIYIFKHEDKYNIELKKNDLLFCFFCCYFSHCKYLIKKLVSAASIAELTNVFILHKIGNKILLQYVTDVFFIEIFYPTKFLLKFPFLPLKRLHDTVFHSSNPEIQYTHIPEYSFMQIQLPSSYSSFIFNDLCRMTFSGF